MAKNFGNAGSSKIFDKVVAANDEKVNADFIKMIANENLFDCEYNDEDVSDTEDLESSINEIGFTDPVEVTAFGMQEGSYMIVSGHRRRVAGVNCGIEKFPCIVKKFDNGSQIKNYLLFSNNQRDTAKDPLLFCKRYKKHEEYLTEINFSGSIREEIARRMGISIQQADRYKQFNNVIKEARELVRNNDVGMSSLLPMASHSDDEQREILAQLQSFLDDGITLTRARCESLISVYRQEKNKKAFEDIEESADKYVDEDVDKNENFVFSDGDFCESTIEKSENLSENFSNNFEKNSNAVEAFENDFDEINEPHQKNVDENICNNHKSIRNDHKNNFDYVQTPTKKPPEKLEKLSSFSEAVSEKKQPANQSVFEVFEKKQSDFDISFEMFVEETALTLHAFFDGDNMINDKKHAEKILVDIKKLTDILTEFTKIVSEKFDL